MDRHPAEIPGRALDAITITRADITAKSVLSLRERYNALKEIEDEDTEYSVKVPRPGTDALYLANGMISLKGDELAVQAPSSNSQKDSLYVKGEKKATIAAREFGIGREAIRTLSGLVTNPLKVTLPSSALTPLRGWVPTFFPTMDRLPEYKVLSLVALKAFIYEVLGHLLGTAPDEETEAKNETIDAGTIIIDHNDLEQKILDRLEK